MPGNNATRKSEKTKLAIALEYPIDSQGGVSVPCRALIKELTNRFEILLVSPDTEEQARNSSVGLCIGEHIQWLPHNVNRENSSILANALSVREVRLAHFHFGGNFGFGSARGCSPLPVVARNGIAVLSTVHMVVHLLEGYCGPQRPLVVKAALLPIAWLAKMRLLASVRAEVVTSQRGFDWLRRWYWPLRSRFRLIYQSAFRQDTLPKINCEREPLVMYAGHLAFRKGHHVLAQAFAQIAEVHPGWRLEMYGQEAEPGGLERVMAVIRACKLEHRVFMRGPHPHAPELMRRAAVYVQPSYFEGLPLALQEAMLCGCACIATDIPGNNELIAHGETGLLVPAGDARGLAVALRQLINDDALRQRLAAAAQNSIIRRGMTFERMVAAYNQLYDATIRTD